MKIKVQIRNIHLKRNDDAETEELVKKLIPEKFEIDLKYDKRNMLCKGLITKNEKNKNLNIQIYN